MSAICSAIPDSAATTLQPNAAELVVHNGRLRGTGHSLTSAITTVGRAPYCDIRLDGAEVSSIHCILANQAQLLYVRTLPGAMAVCVNDEPVFEAELHDGDLLAIGAFCFQVRLQKAENVASSEAPKAAEAGCRAQDLAEQERQAQAFFADREARLTALRDEARTARLAMQRERESFEQRVAVVLANLSVSREALAQAQQDTVVRRERLRRLHFLMQRRHQRLGEARLSEIECRENALAEREKANEKAKTEIVQHRLRVNTELELGRRRLQTAADELRIRENELELEESALRAAKGEMEEQAAALQIEKERWDSERSSRADQLAGLEVRIDNVRRKLEGEQRELAQVRNVIQTVKSAPQLVLSPLQASVQESAAVANGNPANRPFPELEAQQLALRRLAEDLADQRLRLAEECQRLFESRAQWRIQHDSASLELVHQASQLQLQEQQLQMRERVLAEMEARLGDRSQEINEIRSSLEGWKARLATAAASWLSERERTQAKLSLRERELDDRGKRLQSLRETWNKRKRGYLDWLRCQRDLLTARTVDELHSLRASLQGFSEQLNERELEISERQEAWELELHGTRGDQLKEGGEIFLLRRQRDVLEMELATTREEVERLARLLINDGDPESLPATQAA
jgi:chromosome segregation ATPase